MAPKIWTGLVLLNALSGVSAFWRMECRGRTTVSRMDPIVSLGTTAQHAHVVHGSSGFSESADYDALTGGSCTSCAATEDLSAYWTPAMYFAHSDGTFELVEQVGGMLSYYLLRDPKNNVKAFPKGFRMIAGDTNRRNYTLGDVSQPDPGQSSWESLGQTTQDALEQRALGFNCLNYNKDAEASLYRHFMPDKAYLDANCPDGLRLELAFPSCWNGKDLDSTNHRSHMAYPDLVQDGACPEGFETRLVTLFYETIWNTAAFASSDGYFVMANGDPTGFGYHGDFMTGWDEDFLQSAVEQCTNLSGVLSDCPLFTLQDEATQNECKLESMPALLKVENVIGGALDTLNSLPGNVAIEFGPEPASAGKGSGKATTTTSSSYAAPTLTYQPASSSSLGGIFLQDTSTASPTSTSSAASTLVPSIKAAAAQDSTSAPATTAAPTLSDSGVQYQVVSTEYRTNGALVQEIVYEEAVVYVTEDTVTTVTVSPPVVKSEHKKQRRDHLVRHRHHAGGRLI
ncbi:hypothetical protein JX266_009830 [Neoarthrinium moseri]|nr:hypothetical protein JX266_009830 [Neoarthrinium moseri]